MTTPTNRVSEVTGMLYGSIPVTEECSHCGGCGWIVAPEWRDYWKTHERADWSAPTGPEEIRCLTCNGTGRRPTRAAERVLQLAEKIKKEVGKKWR